MILRTGAEIDAAADPLPPPPDGATVLAIVVPAVLSAWRGWQTRQRKAALVTVAEAAPNTVAVVKGTTA